MGQVDNVKYIFQFMWLIIILFIYLIFFLTQLYWVGCIFCFKGFNYSLFDGKIEFKKESINTFLEDIQNLPKKKKIGPNLTRESL